MVYDKDAASKWYSFIFLRRNIVGILAFLGFFNVYTLRVNLSVAIVSMTQNVTRMHANGTLYYEQDFDWDYSERGTILSSFFYGYVLTQLAGGWLGAKVGGARVFGSGIFVTAVLNLATPLAARLGMPILITVRIIEGIFEGVTYPCIHAVWARWAPPQERTRLASFAFSGSFFGTVVAFPACSIFSDYWGWPSAFYIPGAFALLWCLVWFTHVKDGPELDSRISLEELKYLQEILGDVQNQKVKHPWKKFLTSMPVWAIICAHFCENWGFYTMLTQLPSFVNDTLKFDIKEAGFLSALPYLVMSLTLQLAGILIDHLRKKEIFTTTQARKLFNCGAFLSQTVFMTAAAYAETAAASILFITLAVGLGAFAWAAFSVNHLDLHPQHASVLMGISNTFATFAGILSPMVAGNIVKNKSPLEWRIVFFIASGIYLFGAIFYAIFASGEKQDWDSIDENSKIKTSTPENKINSGAYSNPAMHLE